MQIDQFEIGPFLKKYAVPRISSTDIAGEYNDELKMWAIDGVNGKSPIINEPGTLIELVTKTLANQETDDTRMSVSSLLELATKTAAELEKDDNTTSLTELW